MNYQEYEESTDAAPWVSTPSDKFIATGDAQLLPLTPNPLVPSSTSNANLSELVMLGSILQSVQRTQMQQTYLLREFDTRLTRIESGIQTSAKNQAQSFERATWWAIWGLLMLILGGALAVLTVLILLNLQFR